MVNKPHEDFVHAKSSTHREGASWKQSDTMAGYGEDEHASRCTFEPGT